MCSSCLALCLDQDEALTASEDLFAMTSRQSFDEGACTAVLAAPPCLPLPIAIEAYQFDLRPLNQDLLVHWIVHPH